MLPHSPRLSRKPTLCSQLSASWRSPAFFVLGGALLLIANTGCTSVSDYIHSGFKVGPNYRKPAAPVADDWIDSKSQGVNVASKDLKEAVM